MSTYGLNHMSKSIILERKSADRGIGRPPINSFVKKIHTYRVH